MIRKVFHDIGREGGYGVDVVHEFLARGSTVDEAFAHVMRFLDGYQLVRYRSVEALPGDSLPAADALFTERLDGGIAKNRERIRSLLRELSDEGISSLGALEEMGQGYQSKTLHTVAHLIDGFFGIDSFFYNLVEDSHSLSESLRAAIAAAPAGYLLIRVKAST